MTFHSYQSEVVPVTARVSSTVGDRAGFGVFQASVASSQAVFADDWPLTLSVAPVPFT